MPRPTPRRGFTLLELLVVIGIIALLIGILVPTLGTVRDKGRAMSCAARLKSIATGVQLHITDNKELLPQMQVTPAGDRTPVGSPDGRTIGPLFGGKVGLINGYGINRYGGSSRPLNKYVGVNSAPADPAVSGDESPEDIRELSEAFQIDIFESPTDRGLRLPPGVPVGAIGLAEEDAGAVSSMYQLNGTSYILNDHALGQAGDSGDLLERPTLVPCNGGRSPRIRTPNLTWLAASYPIYNYDRGGDLQQRWYDRSRVEANVAFADLHVETTLPVPGPTETDLLVEFNGQPAEWTLGQDGPVDIGCSNVTKNYSFLPEPDWFSKPASAPCE